LYGTIGGSLNISLMVDFGLNASVTSIYVNEDNRTYMGGLPCLLTFVYLPLFSVSRPFLLHIRFLGVLYGVIRRTFHQSRAVRGHRSVWFPLFSACNL